MKDSKILVIGIGGVGGYLSAMLANYYKNVTIIARNERYQKLKETGLILHSDLCGDIVVRPEVKENVKNIEIQDYIFICVKNYSLKEVLEEIQPCVGENTIIVPVLNGVNHGEICEEFLSKGYVVDSLIYIVSSYNKDYSITQQGDYAYLYVGGKNDIQNQMVCDLLNDAQIDCALADNIEKELWNKYILNCAFNILTSYYNCTNTEIRESEVRCKEYKDLLQEAYNIGKAKGVDLDNDLVEKLYHNFIHNQPDGATSSLQRDIEAHRQNELETFSGYLVRLAQSLNISIPQTNYFYQELKRKCV